MKPPFYLIVLAFLPSFSFCEIVVKGDGILQDTSLTKNEATPTKPQASKPDPAGDDLILFDNGDVMHGTFGGIQDGLLWERKDTVSYTHLTLPTKRIV